MRAAAIVMPLPRRVDGASLFGKTLETVLTERPCRVIIESVPDRLRRAAPHGTGAGGRVNVVTVLMSAAMLVLGVAMIAITLSRGGGPLAIGLLFGVLFILAGGGRLWMTLRR